MTRACPAAGASKTRGSARGCVVLAACLAAALAAGCGPQARGGGKGSAAPAKASASAGARPSGAARGVKHAATAAGEQDCADRLHDLSGLLLTYYALNRQMPPSLDDLAPFAESQAEFRPVCPVSGQEYVYVPGGLEGPGTDQRLLVSEPTPAHGGLRLVIVASPAQGDQPPNTRVIPFSEQRLKGYLGNAE